MYFSSQKIDDKYLHGNEEHETALAEQGVQASERKAAAEWALEALADGPLPSDEFYRQAIECGFTKITMRRALAGLGVKSHKTGFNGGWELRLPEQGTGDRAQGTEQREQGTEDGPSSDEDAHLANGNAVTGEQTPRNGEDAHLQNATMTSGSTNGRFPADGRQSGRRLRRREARRQKRLAERARLELNRPSAQALAPSQVPGKLKA